MATSSRRTVILAALALATAWLGATERPPLLLKDADGIVELGGQVDILVDPTGKLGIDDVRSPAFADKFTPSQEKTPAFGFTEDAVWVRFGLRAEPEEPAHYMVELGMARLSHFDWYVVEEGEVVQRLSQGSADLRPGREHASRYPLLSLGLKRGSSATIYARAASDTSVWLPLRVSTLTPHLENAVQRDWTEFAIFGASLAMLLISVSLGVIFRRRIYFMAALMPPCFVLYQVIFGGHYLMLDWPWPAWVGREAMLLVVACFCATLTLFVEDFLAEEAAEPANRRMLRLSKALLGLSVLCVLSLPYRAAAPTAQVLYILSFLCVCKVAVAVARRHPSAENIILVAGALAPLTTTLILLGQWTGLIPTTIEATQILRSVLPATFVIFLLACARSQRKVQEVEAKLAEAHRSETEARLEALRHQLNPHFSYNALASIDALSREAPEKIPELVGRLGAFLRHRMAPSGQPLNELGNELEATRAYLDIERARLEDRLETDYALEPAALRGLVPEFCLQPLAENALKYGLAESPSVRIRISARVREGRLVVTVANTGRIRPDDVLRRGASIGLGNLRRRLALHHRQDARVELAESGGWVTATLDIPFRERSP